MFYECVRLIDFDKILVAIKERDPIHKLYLIFYEGVRLIVFLVAVQRTVFTNLENFQQNFLLLPELTMWKLTKTISLDTVHEMNL